MPQTAFCTVDGLRIRYADSGGSHRQSILLTSPWPESLYCFARIWPALAEQARVFAVDLPGFGASAGRPNLLSPRAMGAFLARLTVDANLGSPHIVAPDAATSAALLAAAQHPDRVASLIVGTGGQYVHSRRDELLALADLLPQITVPVTIVAGRHDRDRARTAATCLADRLPNAHVVLIDAGRFVWEERPWDYAAAIVDSVRAARPLPVAA
jgi:pimeloyl-ACP methyl ester carboxylesterase